MNLPTSAIRLPIQPKAAIQAKANNVFRSTLQKFEMRVPNSEKIDTPPLFCSACGKNMQNPRTGTNVVGVSFKFVADNPLDAPFLQEQIAPYDSAKTYYACYGCWLLALGFKYEPQAEAVIPDMSAVSPAAPVAELDFAPDAP
jgi:hypothetical protein